MADTYCGKNCIECSLMEAESCPGCKAGPGSQNGGACELARCCMVKGHETCETCGYRVTCRHLLNREHQPELRRQKAEAEQRERERKLEEEKKRKQRMAWRAKVLGHWLGVLFWLVVPATIASVMGMDQFRETSPGTYMFGQILNAACSIAYGCVLLKASSEEDRYHTAGICMLVSAAAGVLLVAISGNEEIPPGMLLLALPAAVVALVGEYYEYRGHSAVLEPVDRVLSAKWIVLWKWNIGCTAGTIGSVIIMVMAPMLGYIISLGCLIGVVVVHILKLVYLYSAAKTFRE